MSEYMEKHAVARMIGAPPGYVGYEEGGQLTEAVRRRPYSVVLFDEIEKAHPDVFNVLLQILDDGRLTDSQGRVVDFRNTVIIMTSNLGGAHIVEGGADADPAAWAGIERAVRNDLRAHFRPEFLNRVDDIIVFRPLTREDIRRIVDLQLARLTDLLAARKLGLEVTPAARDLLVRAGIRSGLRRPSAQAGHPAAAAESDRAGGPRGTFPGRIHDPGRRGGHGSPVLGAWPAHASRPVRRGGGHVGRGGRDGVCASAGAGRGRARRGAGRRGRGARRRR